MRCAVCGTTTEALHFYQVFVDGEPLRVSFHLCQTHGDLYLIRVGETIGELLKEKSGHSPPEGCALSFRIGQLWAYVANEPGGDEGIIAENMNGTWVPFIAADETRLRNLKERVMSLPISPGTTVRLVRFDVRTDVEFVRGPQ